MKYLDLSLATPELNLACDEALLDCSELNAGSAILRVWESSCPFIVLGYANRAAREANLSACQESGVPVLRRCSGGGSVVQGPGCLNYSLILPIDPGGPLASITGANRWIMQKQRQASQALLIEKVQVAGDTDLVVNSQKFSGNAQRRKQGFLLFHGTFLLAADMALIEQLLPRPSKEPKYREQREHKEFLCNLRISPMQVKEALQREWQAYEPLREWPIRQTEELARNKYAHPEWNMKY